MNKFIAMSSLRKLLEAVNVHWLESRALATRAVQKDGDSGKTAKSKTGQPNRITLIAPDNSVSITDLVSAQHLSVRRELKLVKIQDIDAKTRRPVYKLLTNAEYHEEELQKRKEKQEKPGNGNKGDKVLTISSKIGQHDLMTRVRNAVKWLEKQYEIRVVITGDGDDKTQAYETVYSAIESNVKAHGKIVQKRTKGNSMRFQILPNVANKNPELQEKLQANTSHNEGGESKAPHGEAPL